MNYFEYNENRYARKPGETSKTQMEVIEAPAYWVTEHGEIADDVYQQFTHGWEPTRVYEDKLILAALRDRPVSKHPALAAGFELRDYQKRTVEGIHRLEKSVMVFG